MKSYDCHPACLASPAMSPECYEAFKADIEKNGLVQPIVLRDGMVLDGRHRQQACSDLEIDAHYITDDELIETQGDPWAYVWSSMMRKNHSESQLSIYAAEWQGVVGPKKMGRPKKGESKKSGTDALLILGQQRDVAAKKYGIGGRTVSKAANVLEKGCKQLQQAVKDGRVNVTLAEKVAKNMDIEKQQEVVSVAMVAEKPEAALRDAVKVEKKPKAKKRPSRKDRTGLSNTGRRAIKTALNALRKALEACGLDDIFVKQLDEMDEKVSQL